MNRRLAFLLAIFAQFAFLGWMIGMQERVLTHGRRVTLAIEPVDPIDPLSGRYLAIRVKASRVDLAPERSWMQPAEIEQQAEALVGHEVVVTLTEVGDRWIAHDVSEAIEYESGRAPLGLRGQVRRREGTTLVVDYGLDRFFIPADASDPSSLLWQPGHELAIVARVMTDGRASIEDLLVDGQPFTRWNAAQKPK